MQRTNTRSAVTRGSPSSPPKRLSQSPTRRVTRAARSGSVDLDAEIPATRERDPAASRRRARQTSADSNGGGSDVDRSSHAQTNKKSRKRAFGPHLSMVIEDTEDQAMAHDDADYGIDHNPPDPERYMPDSARAKEPGFDAQQSAEGLEKHAVLESLPDLYQQASQMLKLLVKPAALPNIIQELQIPGSETAILLKHNEEEFRQTRRLYEHGEIFIGPNVIDEQLFGDVNPGTGNFRPDAIIYAANLAILATNIITLSRESRHTQSLLDYLNRDFPMQFLAGYSNTIRNGMTILQSRTLDLLVEIRTQYLICFLHHERMRDGDEMDANLPRRTLDELFGPKNSTTEPVVAGLQQRFEAISASFYGAAEIEANGDLYDDEKLTQDFPWSDFQQMVVEWIAARHTEIQRCVRAQGGPDGIVSSLADFLGADAASEVEQDTVDEQILPTPGAQSLFGQGMHEHIRATERLKAIMSQSGAVKSKAASAAVTQKVVQLAPAFEEAESGIAPIDDETGAAMPDNRAINAYIDLQQEKNKENIQRRDRPRTFVDRQPGAQKERWNEGDESDDQFEQLVAERPRERRKPAPVAKRSVPDERAVRAAKRTRPNQERPVPATATEHQGSAQHGPLVVGARADSRAVQNATRQQSEGSDSDESDAVPNPTQASISARQRRYKADQAAGPTLPGARIPWSDADTKTLIKLIGLHNCSWSMIQRCGSWEVERDQVAIKDKARNLKVVFLKANTRLPVNFENIRMGKKEVDAVKRVRPDYNGV